MPEDNWGTGSDRTDDTGTEWGADDTGTEWGADDTGTGWGADDTGTEWGADDTGTEWDDSPTADSYGQTPRESEFGGGEPSSRLAAALVGGAVGFGLALVASFVPLIGILLSMAGTVIGGLVAGYLRGSDTKESAITGGLAGVVSIIPGLLLAGLVALIFSGAFFLEGGEGVAAGGFIFVTIAIVALIAIVINVTFSAIGGALGANMSDRRPPRP